MRYLIDTCVLVQASRFHYPFDIFPSFWEWLDKKNEEGLVYLPDQVIMELNVGADELYDWVKEEEDAWSMPCSTEAVQSKFVEVSNWAMAHPQFTPPAKSEFLSVADSWIIALAMTGDFTIVTEEKSAPASKKRIIVPDVCREFGIECCTTIELFRKLNGNF